MNKLVSFLLDFIAFKFLAKISQKEKQNSGQENYSDPEFYFSRQNERPAT